MDVLAYYIESDYAVNYDYSAGFKPDIEWNEYDLTQNPTDALLPLGDPDEFMLGKMCIRDRYIAGFGWHSGDVRCTKWIL